MAQFEGTIKEFNRFIGPYARLQVAFLAAKYKKQKGGCEDCGHTEGLDAAHIKGKDRASLIAAILSEYTEGNIVRVDLQEFKERFLQVHLPLASTIRVLCKRCHLVYDKATEESAPGNPMASTEESAVVEDLIQQQMNKSKAMKIAYTRQFNSLTNTNTIFSNVIAALESWWLQSSNEKFKKELYFILNDDKSSGFYLLKLPANTITNPATHFKQRNDSYRTNCSDIYIPTSGLKFKEKNGYDFSPFIIDKITY